METRYVLFLGPGSDPYYSHDSKESVIEEGTSLSMEWLVPGHEEKYFDDDLDEIIDIPSTGRTSFEIAPICNCVSTDTAVGTPLVGDSECDLCDGSGFVSSDSEVIEVVAEPEEPEVDNDAPDAFALVRTAFHNGGLISTHKTIEHAAWAKWDHYGYSSCACGRSVIVRASELDDLRSASECIGYSAPAI